jgi:hypothetical protein
MTCKRSVQTLNGKLTNTDPNVTATLVVKFMKDRTIVAKLSTCDGVNARMLDALPGVVFKELNALRTKKRLEDTVKQHAAKQKREEEERRVNEEKANAS